MKERQMNTKMLFVKTKQETVWWFLLPGKAGFTGFAQVGNM